MNGTSYLKLLIRQSYLSEWTLTKSLIIPPKNSNILCDTGKESVQTLGMRKRSLLAGRAQISRAKNRDLLSCE